MPPAIPTPELFLAGSNRHGALHIAYHSGFLYEKRIRTIPFWPSVEEDMPRCELTKATVERLKNTIHQKKTAYMDTDIRGLLLECRPSGTGTWYFRCKDSKGRWKLVRLGALHESDLLEIKAMAYELLQLIEREGSLDNAFSIQNGSLTFSAFIKKYYMPHSMARKRSWKNEAGMLRRNILPALGSMKLNSITRHTLVRWQEALLNKGLAPSTCNRSLFLLKYAFNCARRWSFIEASPAADITPLPEKDFRERYLSVAEAQRLLNALDADQNKQAGQIIRLLLFTGARKAEILAARWEHVDIERRILTVPISKSGRARHIPLSDVALLVLAKLPRHSAWLFPSSRTSSHITCIFQAWDRIRTRAGLKDLRLHDLRHSFASFLVDSGCSLYEVQKILGHHDPKVTMRYAHLTQDSLLRAANIVGNKMDKISL